MCFHYLGAHGDEGHELHEHERDGDEEDVELAGRARRVPHVHEHDPQQRPDVGDDRHHLDLQVAAIAVAGNLQRQITASVGR